jgi:galactokinase
MIWSASPGHDRERKSIRIEAPGRICLLGEHQDYLGLEVISGAMNLTVHFKADPSHGHPGLNIHLLQTGQTRHLDTSAPGVLHVRDYLQSGLNTMLDKGFRYRCGYTISINGDLPIGKGVSSSSALCVGWIKLLAAIADEPAEPSPDQTAAWAFESEVTRFGEPGGMQDHIASVRGGLLQMNFHDAPSTLPHITPLKPVPEGFLLVDSGQTKDTIGMIARIRAAVETQFGKICGDSRMLLSELQIDQLPAAAKHSNHFRELRGTLLNRDITRYAFQNWPSNPDTFPEFLSPLINAHHRYLSDSIGSSSEAIDSCIEWCMTHGARAGKVIGSGGGGCLLIYAPGNTQILMGTLRSRGLRVWNTGFSRGVMFA